MRINQLFNKPVELPLVLQALRCFGLNGLDDRRMFCKDDLDKLDTLRQLDLIVPVLRAYYMPCKARTYLENIGEKRAITILKQVLRLHGYILLSRERNVKGRKVIYYQLMGAGDVQKLHHMTKTDGGTGVTVSFS